MSQLNSMAIPMEGKYSKSELLELKNKMNAKALAKRRSKTALRLAANIIFAILVLLPLLYAVSIALMPSNELFTTDLNLFPKHPTLQNFKEAFTTVPLLRFILNSFIMAGCITIGQIISCSLAAFAFSFLEFKGKGILFAIVMATMMVPGEATIISNYLTVGSWGILDTYAVLIIPYLTSAMGIFLFRQFYMTFPMSLYESAKLDGAGELKVFTSIILPISKPFVATCILFIGVAHWNNWYDTAFFVRDKNLATMSYLMMQVINSTQVTATSAQHGASSATTTVSIQAAAMMVSTIPIICVYPFLQKYFVSGMLVGSVKE